MERDGERDDFQGNGKSLRGGNTREKQSEEEMHLPDRAAAVGQQLHKLCHSSVVRRLTGEESEEREKILPRWYSSTVFY